MLPATQSSLVRWMRVTDTPRGLSEGLARFVRLEYGGDAAQLREMIAQADGAWSAKNNKGVGRTILRVLAKIPDALVQAATPGGA